MHLKAARRRTAAENLPIRLRRTTLPEPLVRALWRTLINELPDFDPAAFAESDRPPGPALPPQLARAMTRCLDHASPTFRASWAATVAEDQLRRTVAPLRHPEPLASPEEPDDAPAAPVLALPTARGHSPEVETLLRCPRCGATGEVARVDLTYGAAARVECPLCRRRWTATVAGDQFAEVAALARDANLV